MIWIILFALSVGGLFWVEEGEWLAAIGFGILGGLVGFTAAMLWGIGADGEIRESTSRQNLVSLADTRSVEGDFFLGSGSVNGYAVYVWYEQDGDAYVQREAPASDARIHLISEGQPYYKVYTRKEKIKTSLNWYQFTIGMTSSDDPKYDFYVPRGSITRTYKLDAQ